MGGGSGSGGDGGGGGAGDGGETFSIFFFLNQKVGNLQESNNFFKKRLVSEKNRISKTPQSKGDLLVELEVCKNKKMEHMQSLRVMNVWATAVAYLHTDDPAVPTRSCKLLLVPFFF
jgi:hypothetical protein